ncbi:uncharacterized protein VNE69_09096 [Vairimorpha necatrix]|uniref:Uncharacterized protein n=1 Tax=Vairimorpha necatrix TaxID=6039 RepID=A0AAX4JF01_9MICR
MLFSFGFLRCTHLYGNDYTTIKINEHKHENFTGHNSTCCELDKSIYNVHYNDNLVFSNIERSVVDDDYDNSIILRNDVSLSNKIPYDSTESNQNKNYSNDVVTNINLGLDNCGDIFSFESDIYKSQASSIFLNNENFLNISTIIKECNNTILDFIENKKLTFGTNLGLYSKKKLDTCKDSILKNHNYLIRYFKRDFIYSLDNKRLQNLSKLIVSLDVDDYIKDMLLEFIKVFKLFIKIYDKRENIIHNKFLATKYFVKLIRYNIEIMSVFNYIPIVETFKQVEIDLLSKEYKSELIKAEVRSILKSITRDLFSLMYRSNEVIRIYEKCIEVIEK